MPRPTFASSAAASRASGQPSTRRRATPIGTSSSSRATRSVRVRRAGTAVSSRRRSRTGSATASATSPTRSRRSSGSGSRTSTGSGPTSTGSGSTATSRRAARSPWRSSPTGRPARRGGGAAAGLRARRRAARRRRRCAPRSIRRPTWARLWDRTGAALVDPGKLADGLRARRARLGVRSTAAPGRVELSGMSRRPPRRRWRCRGPRRSGAARDERVPAATAGAAPLHRPRLRLRAGHRAAHR